MQSEKQTSSNTSLLRKSKESKETPVKTSSKTSVQKQKRIILEYDSELIVHVVFNKADEKRLSCEWLLTEGIKNMKAIAEKKKIMRDFSKIVAFTTKSKNLLIDYWLTQPEEDLSMIDDGTVLVPYFKTKSLSSTISDGDEDEERKARLADFEFLSLIGKGGFSKVFLARKKDNGRFYAIKKIQKGDKTKFEKEKRGIQREKNNMMELKFPSFVQLHYSFQTEKNYYFVLDYIPGGDLYQQLRQNVVFLEEDAKFYIAEVLIGLNTLHTNNYIHRDLKPENLLLDLKGHIHFADFGLSKVFKRKSDYHYTFCGTPEYMAPEVITGTGYNVLADYYSLGSLAYELVVGVPPFQRAAGNSKEIFRNIVTKAPNMPTKISEEGRSFISGLLEKKPQNRLGAKQGYKELIEHPWFAGIDFKNLALRTMNGPIKLDPKSLILSNTKNQIITDYDDDALEAKINEVDDLKVSGFSYFSVSDVGSPQLFVKRQLAMARLQANKSVKPGGAEETIASVLKTPKMVSPNRGIRQLMVNNQPLQMYTKAYHKPAEPNPKSQNSMSNLTQGRGIMIKGLAEATNDNQNAQLLRVGMGMPLPKVIEEDVTPKRMASHIQLKLIADERSPFNKR